MFHEKMIYACKAYFQRYMYRKYSYNFLFVHIGIGSVFLTKLFVDLKRVLVMSCLGVLFAWRLE